MPSRPYRSKDTYSSSFAEKGAVSSLGPNSSNIKSALSRVRGQQDFCSSQTSPLLLTTPFI